MPENKWTVKVCETAFKLAPLTMKLKWLAWLKKARPKIYAEARKKVEEEENPVYAIHCPECDYIKHSNKEKKVYRCPRCGNEIVINNKNGKARP